MDSLGYKRLDIMGVPVDLVPQDEMIALLEKLLEKGGGQQIIFLKFSDLLKARRKGEYRQAVTRAALVLPLSKRILRAAKYLKLDVPVIYKPFDLIIRIFGLMERKGKSAYLLGSTVKRMQKSHKNLKDSFPGLNFVGRYTGFYNKSLEKNIVIAIKKASPSFLLAGRGLKGKDLWLFKHKEALNCSIMLWDKHCYEIFAGKRRKPSYTGFSSFVKGLLKIIIMPWRLLLIFRFLWYLIALTVERIKRKREPRIQTSKGSQNSEA
ncbi:MAG: WecB/TagA/CpsF family glycosyltransferase [Spirochaetaceae bacterium]|nr:WecB/TagA/CpsF family glycosyltransferase [Spirochaetaceae bacterium]